MLWNTTPLAARYRRTLDSVILPTINPKKSPNKKQKFYRRHCRACSAIIIYQSSFSIFLKKSPKIESLISFQFIIYMHTFFHMISDFSIQNYPCPHPLKCIPLHPRRRKTFPLTLSLFHSSI